jgi:hypothetical protein
MCEIEPRQRHDVITFFCMEDEEEDVQYVPSDSGDEFSDTEKISVEKMRREVNSGSNESEVSKCS